MNLLKILGFVALGLGCTNRNLQVKPDKLEEKDVINCYDNPGKYSEENETIAYCEGQLKDGRRITFKTNIIETYNLRYVVDSLNLFYRNGLLESYIDPNNGLGFAKCGELQGSLYSQMVQTNNLCEPASKNSPVDYLIKYQISPKGAFLEAKEANDWETEEYLNIRKIIFPNVPYGPWE